MIYDLVKANNIISFIEKLGQRQKHDISENTFFGIK